MISDYADTMVQLVFVRVAQVVAARHGHGVDLGAMAADEAVLVRRLAGAATATPAAAAHATDAMATLARQHGWCEATVELLWLAVALRLHPLLSTQARALDSAASEGATLGLLAEIATVEARALRQLALQLAIGHSAVSHDYLKPVAHGGWQATIALLRAIGGDDAPPWWLTRVAAPASPIYDEPQAACVTRLADVLACPGIIELRGPAGSGRVAAVATAAERRRGEVLNGNGVVAVCDLDGQAAHHHVALVRELLRWARVHDCVPIIRGRISDEAWASLRQGVAEHAQACVVVTSVEARTVKRMVSAALDWPMPEVATRTRLWHTLALGLTASEAATLGQRYRVGVGHIARAAHVAKTSATRLGACEAALREGLQQTVGDLATRCDVRQGWDDLVLSAEVSTQIDALVARQRHAPLVFEQWGYASKLPKGTGTAALFSGPPGTGKTMVAGLIARELGLELYQVDVSKVVSKWVGEAEKHLASLFEAADAGHMVLLFDEADALFAQRSVESRGGSDRYANLSVNYLLQRIEAFHGMVILTTNLESVIDKAVMRRLAAHVRFAAPEEAERRQLWTRHLRTPQAPLAEDIDVARLARQFSRMAGAHIRNAALGAAFLAAARGAATVTHAHVEAAARQEYLSMGHVLAGPITDRLDQEPRAGSARWGEASGYPRREGT